MKKYFVGFLVGAVFTVSATAFADDIKSLVGKTIQGEATVVLNGQLLDKAIIVDGKSYAPVRALGEAAGYFVTMEDRKVILKSEVKDVVRTTSENLNEPRTVEDANWAIDKAKADIERYKATIESYELNVLNSATEEVRASNQLMLDSYKKQLKEAEQRLVNLEQQKVQLENK